MTGTLYGVGVGPGDPELLTLKAVRVLQDAPVIAYPAPLEGESLARSIASPHIPSGKTEVAIRLPFSPDRGDTEERYDRAAEVLISHLEAGRDVALLCLGDPLLYGSFVHVLPRIGNHFHVSIVPGISSISAAAAAIGLPLAIQDETLSIIPATLDAETLAARIAAADVAAVMKIGRHLKKLQAVIATLGLSAEARYIEYAATGTERVRPLADVTESDSVYFALVLVRKRAWR